jgi:ubiquinone/menaquinone biosynthesis C-methylase UbiE
MPEGTVKRVIMGLAAIAGVVLSGVSGWSYLMYRAFDYNGKRQMSRRIIEGISDYVSLPEDGNCLDVGCGSGALAIAIAKRNPKAHVTGIDRWGKEYASFNKELCESNARAEGVSNIRFQQGDVGALTFADNTFDIVLSLNGFHAFPDKEAAYRETYRVLKPGGTFCGCFYVQGSCGMTDWFIRHLYQPKGYFTPPYESEESLRKRLSGMYSSAEVSSVEGIACFCCVK